MSNMSKSKPKRPGRPVSQLASQVWLRCTEDERSKWERAAVKDGRTLSGWIRAKLRLAA